MKTQNAFKNLSLLVLVMIAIVSMTACNRAALNPLVRYNFSSTEFGTIQANFCTSPPSPGRQNLKYLFILDHSASNGPTISADDVSGTDADGARRYGPLVEFVNGLSVQTATNISYGLIDFNNTAQQPQMLSGFETNAATFVAKVTADWIGSGTPTAPAPADSGFTNYQSAIALAKTLIDADVRNQAVQPDQQGVVNSYVIIFVSDGVPRIASSSDPSGTVVQDYEDDIQPVIKEILDLKNEPTFGPLISNITLNTAYYHGNTEIMGAAELLTKMSSYGNGQFLSFNPGQNILYSQFAPPSRQLINKLVDVFVENKNLVWWDDGRLYLDSDADGLPDAIELQIASNPDLADSDGNGVRDSVEYRVKGFACNDANCAPAGRDRYASCAGFNPVTALDGSVTFQSSTNDGLNDCEKFVLGASRSSYNTNGSFIPDEFAFRSGLPIVSGTDSEAFADPFSDGLNNYSKLKASLPVQVSMRTLYEHFDQTVTIRPAASSQTDISCYNITAENIPVSYGSNQFRMMIIQNSTVLQDKPFLLNAVVNLPPGARSATFSKDDFK
jgi:hypothetical protein